MLNLQGVVRGGDIFNFLEPTSEVHDQQISELYLSNNIARYPEILHENNQKVPYLQQSRRNYTAKKKTS